MAFAEDAADFLDTDDFAVDVTWSGGTIPGILDEGYEEQFGVAGTKPRVRVATADLGAITRGTAVTVDGASYTVQNLEPEAPDAVFTFIVLETA